MPRPPLLTLDRILARLASLSPPRHRDLVRGMVAELDAIAEPGERRRFAWGAVAAIARLALGAFFRAAFRAPARLAGIGDPGGAPDSRGPMSITARRLLRLHATPFGLALASLTGLLVTNNAVGYVRRLSAEGASTGAIIEVILLTLPHTLALTIPMALFIAVTWVFARLAARGALGRVRSEPGGMRRLVVPVLGAAAVIGALTFVSNAQVVPRSNARLAAALAGGAPVDSDRTMTLGELRDAASSARAEGGDAALAREAALEVEIHKKLALAAACLILALAGAAIPMRFPGGGVPLVVVASGLVFAGYYVALVGGESMADRQVISPALGMWSANVLLLALVLLLARPSGGPARRGGVEGLALE